MERAAASDCLLISQSAHRRIAVGQCSDVRGRDSADCGPLQFGTAQWSPTHLGRPGGAYLAGKIVCCGLGGLLKVAAYVLLPSGGEEQHVRRKAHLRHPVPGVPRSPHCPGALHRAALHRAALHRTVQHCTVQRCFCQGHVTQQQGNQTSFVGAEHHDVTSRCTRDSRQAWNPGTLGPARCK